MGPGGGPVIDLDALMVGQAEKFFGRRARGINRKLVSIKTAKAFPKNVELAFEVPLTRGVLKTLHYSISVIPNTGYKPRESDERIGYFLTVFKDLTKTGSDGTNFVRHINRWNIQKRAPSLSLSPPVNPIVFFIEHTVPVRYRRFVRDGILEWNKAFEKIGILNAIEVRQQDARTAVFMDIDPEDVRYNFFRWVSS